MKTLLLATSCLFIVTAASQAQDYRLPSICMGNYSNRDSLDTDLLEGEQLLAVCNNSSGSTAQVAEFHLYIYQKGIDPVIFLSSGNVVRGGIIGIMKSSAKGSRFRFEKVKGRTSNGSIVTLNSMTLYKK